LQLKKNILSGNISQYYSFTYIFEEMHTALMGIGETKKKT